MPSEIATALIGGAAGLGTGVVGSLFAPWAQWGVDKRRLRREDRVKRVAEWRQGIETISAAKRRADQLERLQNHPQYEDEAGLDEAIAALARATDLDQQSWFHSLEPHLSRKRPFAIRGPRPLSDWDRIASRVQIVSEEYSSLTDDNMAQYLVPALSRAVLRIEKKWKLS